MGEIGHRLGRKALAGGGRYPHGARPDTILGSDRLGVLIRYYHREAA